MNWEKKRICAFCCASPCAGNSLLGLCAGSRAKAEVPDTIPVDQRHPLHPHRYETVDCAVFGGMEATEANKKLMIPFLTKCGA